MRGLHGRGRHPTPGAQRVPHAAARRRGPARDLRQPHIERRRQRSPARLGGHGREHPLLLGVGHGPPPLPVDGARAPAGHRRRGAGAVPGHPGRRRPGPGAGLRGRRVQRGRDVRRVRRDGRRPGRGGGGRRLGHGARDPRHPARHALLSAPGRVGPDPRSGVHLGRPGLPGHRARAFLPARRRAGPVRAGERRRGARRGPAPVPDGGHHPGPGAGPRPGLAHRRGPAQRDRRGVDGAHDPLRPGGQGRRDGDGAAR